MNKSIIAIAVLVAVLLAGGTWYYATRGSADTPEKTADSSQTNTNGTSGSPDSSTSKSSDSSDQEDKKTYQVYVYFSKHPESDNDPSATFPVARTSPNLGVATFAISELLKGPTADEVKQGYFSTAKLRDGTGSNDFKLTIKDGTATLRFLKQFDHLGVVADGQAESILKATLKQFPDVKNVVILNAEGNCEFDLSGLNKCLE